MQNEELEKENREMKQEKMFLYSILESFHCHNDHLKALKKKNRNLENSLTASTQFIKKIKETNNKLVRNLPEFHEEIEDIEEITEKPSESSVQSVIFEKNALLKRIVDLDNVYFNYIKEMDDLKIELIYAKAKYAESVTEKNEFYKRLIDQKRIKV